jgi:hypothetical protein
MVVAQDVAPVVVGVYDEGNLLLCPASYLFEP